MPARSRSADLTDRYWRTYQRKLGEDLDLAGKGALAAAFAALLAPLASKGTIAFPSPAIALILGFGFGIVLIGIHLQATAKPDE